MGQTGDCPDGSVRTPPLATCEGLTIRGVPVEEVWAEDYAISDAEFMHTLADNNLSHILDHISYPRDCRAIIDTYTCFHHRSRELSDQGLRRRLDELGRPELYTEEPAARALLIKEIELHDYAAELAMEDRRYAAIAESIPARMPADALRGEAEGKDR